MLLWMVEPGHPSWDVGPLTNTPHPLIYEMFPCLLFVLTSTSGLLFGIENQKTKKEPWKQIYIYTPALYQSQIDQSTQNQLRRHRGVVNITSIWSTICEKPCFLWRIYQKHLKDMAEIAHLLVPIHELNQLHLRLKMCALHR